MNRDPKARPWMKAVEQIPKLGPVGVLKPRCTTKNALIGAIGQKTPIMLLNHDGAASPGIVSNAEKSNRRWSKDWSHRNEARTILIGG